MFQKRSALWLMLFSGVVIHMICNTGLNIAITSMAKLHPINESDKIATHACDSGIHPASLNSTTAVVQSPVNEGEFDWSDTEKGLILSSSAWFFGFAKLFGGILCQKYGGKAVFGFATLAIGTLSIFMPLATMFGVWAIATVRVLQGISAGASIGTASSVLISKWIPEDERGKYVATGAGLYAGIALSYFLNGWIIHWFGWRAVFYAAGILALAWCFLWYLLVFDSPRQHPHISQKELEYIESATLNAVSDKQLAVPWIAILTSIPFLANVVANQGLSWTTYTYVLYMPTYLREVHGLPSYMIGQFSSIPYVLQAAFAVGLATFTDFLIQRKVFSITTTRKLAAFFSLVVAGVLVGFMVFCGCNLVLSLSIFTVVSILNGSALAGVHPNLVDLSPNFTAILNGLEGFINSNIGYISPIVVSYVMAHNSGLEAWNKIFLLTSIINIIPGLVFMIFGDGKTQKWNFENGETAEQEEDETTDKMEHQL